MLQAPPAAAELTFPKVIKALRRLGMTPVYSGQWSGVYSGGSWHPLARWDGAAWQVDADVSKRLGDLKRKHKLMVHAVAKAKADRLKAKTKVTAKPEAEAQAKRKRKCQPKPAPNCMPKPAPKCQSKPAPKRVCKPARLNLWSSVWAFLVIISGLWWTVRAASGISTPKPKRNPLHKAVRKTIRKTMHKAQAAIHYLWSSVRAAFRVVVNIEPFRLWTTFQVGFRSHLSYLCHPNDTLLSLCLTPIVPGGGFYMELPLPQAPTICPGHDLPITCHPCSLPLTPSRPHFHHKGKTPHPLRCLSLRLSTLRAPCRLF